MWDYRATIIEVADGDTVRALMDQGFGSRQQEDLRLKEVWAPELHQPGGVETAEFVRGLVAGLDKTRRWPVLVTTEPNTNREPSERRSFVRYIAVIHDASTGRSLNDTIRQFLASHPEWPGGVGSGA